LLFPLINFLFIYLFIYLFTLSSCSSLLSLLFLFHGSSVLLLPLFPIILGEGCTNIIWAVEYKPRRDRSEICTAAHFEHLNWDIFDLMSPYFLEVLEGRNCYLHTSCHSHDPTKSMISENKSRGYVGDKLYENIRSPWTVIWHCGIFNACCVLSNSKQLLVSPWLCLEFIVSLIEGDQPYKDDKQHTIHMFNFSSLIPSLWIYVGGHRSISCIFTYSETMPYL